MLNPGFLQLVLEEEISASPWFHIKKMSGGVGFKICSAEFASDLCIVRGGDKVGEDREILRMASEDEAIAFVKKETEDVFWFETKDESGTTKALCVSLVRGI